MSAQKRIQYLEILRGKGWAKKFQEDKFIEPSFRGTLDDGDIYERLAFTEKCLEHERIQLRKTVEILRRVERERDDLQDRVMRLESVS